LNIAVTNPAPGGGTTASVAFIVADYNVTVAMPTATVTAGVTATYSLSLALANATNANPINFAVTSGLPAGTTASFSPSGTVPAGSGAQTITLSIATTPHSALTSAAFPRREWPHAYSPSWTGLRIAVFGFGLLAFGIRKRRLAHQLLFAMMLLSATGLIACGSTSGPSSPTQLNPATGTPAGTYMIVVTTTSGGATLTTTLTLTVM